MKAVVIISILSLLITLLLIKNRKSMFVREPEKVNKIHNNNSEILVVSHHTLDTKFIKNSINNHIDYCNKHKYDYWFRNNIINNDFSLLKDEIMFQKISVVKECLDKGYKYVFWLDSDAVFTNFELSLFDIMKKIGFTNNHFLAVARDMACLPTCVPYACVNAGVLLFYNCEESRSFVNTWFSKALLNDERIVFHDQGVLNEMIYENAIDCSILLNDKVLIIEDTSLFNSPYSDSPYLNKWEPGHFIAHFAGVQRDKKNNIIPLFLKCLSDGGYCSNMLLN